MFPLVHACYKNLQHRSKHNPINWAWRNRAKLNFLSDIHWLNDIKPLVALFSFSVCMCNMFCFLWPSWMKFLRYAYIYISYRWDLAATSLAYIWYLDATSVKRKRTLTVPRSPEQGTVRVRLLHSSLHILCFDICIDWQEEKQMTRLNSLHPSLGARKNQKKQKKNKKNKKKQKKTKKPKKNKKNKKTKDMPPMPTVSRNLWFFRFFQFFCFFSFFSVFLFFLVFCGFLFI